MNVQYSIQLSPQAAAFLHNLGAPQELAIQLASTMDDVNEDTLNEIRKRLNVYGGSKRGKKESASGAYLYPHKISGRLQASMGKTDTIIIGNGSTMQIAATIGSGVAGGGQAVRYAGIQEFGGTVTVPSRARRSKNPSYLRSHPGQTKGYSFDVPSRSYLMSTIGERIQVYNRRLSRTIKDFYSGN